MSENKKKLKIAISIIVILIVVSCPIAYNKYVEYKEYKIQEQARLEAEQEIIAQEQEIERINNLEIMQKIYLAIDEPYELDCEILDGNSIEIILKDDKKYVVGKTTGETIVYIKDLDSKYMFSVSDLYEVAHIDNHKKKIPADIYTEEQAQYLDEALKSRIEAVGYKTRAAVVEAARFLSMNFSYRIPYFCENGRLTSNGCDGEGRFYHQGLYLTESKYALLNPDGIKEGPKAWGGYMQDVCTDYERPNGLDCSGFVTWCLVQAGFDPGDYGAGNNFEGGYFCLPDLADGDAGAKWLDEIDPNVIQAGDIICWQGTVAIIVGVDDENIYTAHEYWTNDLEVVTDTKDSLKVFSFAEDNEDWQYVALMDNYYKENGNGQGNYTAMWNAKLD